MRLCIVYLASPRAFTIRNTNGRIVSRLEVLRRSVEITRRCFPTTDILVFHEDYTPEDKAAMPGVTDWISIDFVTRDVPYASTNTSRKGYLLMCRFFCGELQSHPRLQSYTHYMRLDDDSYFMEPFLTEESVRPLLAHDYVYRSAFIEFRDQQSLYEFTMRFLARTGVSPIELRMREARLAAQSVVVNGRYAGYAPYNNFHIASLRLWQTPLVQRYLREMDAMGGIFRYGWLDANIHAMILYVLNVTRAHLETSFGYRHNFHVSPLGEMYPRVDESLSFYPIYDGEASEEACPAESVEPPTSSPSLT